MKRRRTRYLADSIFDKCARFIIKARRERRYLRKLAQEESQGALEGTQGQTSPLPAQAKQVEVQAPSVSEAAAQSAETREGVAVPEAQIPEPAALETTQNKSEDDTRIVNEVVEREFNRWGGAILQVEKVLQNKIPYTDLDPGAKEILANLLRAKERDLLRWNETRINQIRRARQKLETGGQLTNEEQEALADFNAVRGVLKMALLRKFERIKNRDFGETMDLINKIKAIASNAPIELTEEDFRDIKAAIRDLEGKAPQEWIQRAPVEGAAAPISPEEKKNLFTLFSNMSPLAKLAVFSGVPLMLVGLLQAASGKEGTLTTGIGAVLFALGVTGPEKLFGGSKTASRYFRSCLSF
jgi:hypothetical protein